MIPIKEMKLVSVNLVRDRPNLTEMKSELQNLGADYVLTEEEFKSDEGRKILKAIGREPTLALNCVGGKSAMYLAACLGRKGKMVTYGGMSKMPLQVPTGPLIFKQIELHGFWMSYWYTFSENREERGRMMKFLQEMIGKGHLKSPECDMVELKDFEKALDVAIGGSGKKQILVME